MGFGTHGHRDMEIVSYVLEGALEHKDSIGNGSVIRPGDVQRMSAGTGVRHSEFNPSPGEPVHFLQIWIEPTVDGHRAGLRGEALRRRVQARPAAARSHRPTGATGRSRIHQDAYLYATLLDGAERAAHAVALGRKSYVHVARGKVTANGQPLAAGDALKATDVGEIVLERADGAEVLLFDLP